MTSDPITHATMLLKTGRLVAMPTETVYGLGADAMNETALLKIYQAKGRPQSNPLIIHLPDAAAMENWAIDIPEAAYLLAKHFWPGPLTLILKKHPRVSNIVTGNQPTVALRVPNHPVALALLRAFGGGIAAPSANRSGRISPTTSEAVREELGTSVDYILEGGPCQIGIESTIVSCDIKSTLVASPHDFYNDFKILRPGSISREEIAKVLSQSNMMLPNAMFSSASRDTSAVSTTPVTPITPVTPGSSESHYAPAKPLYLLDFDKNWLKPEWQNMCFSVLSFEECAKETIEYTKENIECAKENILWHKIAFNPKEFAKQLYQRLRQMDKEDSTFIVVQKPPNTPEWLAILDRLQRASSG